MLDVLEFVDAILEAFLHELELILEAFDLLGLGRLHVLQLVAMLLLESARLFVQHVHFDLILGTALSQFLFGFVGGQLQLLTSTLELFVFLLELGVSLIVVV